MKESKKSKKENIRKKLDVLEANIKLQNQQEINELLEKIGDHTLTLDVYIDTINTEVSFDITLKLSDEEN